MNVFQIFDRATPPREPFAGFMRAILGRASHYTLVAPADFLGADSFYPLEALQVEVEAALPGVAVAGRYRFDALRAYFLARHFDHVYLDVDVELLSPIDLQAKCQADTPGVMAGNGDPALGPACWARYAERCRRVLRPASQMFSGFPVQEAPKNSYHHHFAHGDY